MSHAAPLMPQPRAAKPTPEMQQPTLPPNTTAPGEAGEQFRLLLESKPSELPAPVAVDEAGQASDDDESDRARRGDAATAAPLDLRPFAPAPERVSPPASKADAPTAEPKTLRDALAIDNDRTAAQSAPTGDADAPRTSGAQVRQQQLWAQAQRETTADKTATPSLNMQAFDAAPLHVAPTVAPSDASAAAAPRGADDDFVALLLNHCSQMYVAQGADANNTRMLLDLGHTLPGSLVELARDGAFLRVRLHAADAQAGQLMDAQRERLVAALERSTRLAVVVDVVRTR